MIRFVLYLLLLAAVLYGVFWAIDRRNTGGDSPKPVPRPRGPLGPDDDEAFLRDLGRPHGTPPGKPQSNPAPPPAPNPHPPTSQETHEHPE